jgi:hypothetical protein
VVNSHSLAEMHLHVYCLAQDNVTIHRAPVRVFKACMAC